MHICGKNDSSKGRYSYTVVKRPFKWSITQPMFPIQFWGVEAPSLLEGSSFKLKIYVKECPPNKLFHVFREFFSITLGWGIYGVSRMRWYIHKFACTNFFDGFNNNNRVYFSKILNISVLERINFMLKKFSDKNSNNKRI